MSKRLSALLLFFAVVPSWGQILIEDPGHQSTPKRRTEAKPVQDTAVGESAARKYFSARQPAETVESTSVSSGGPRFLNLYLGTFLNDKQYRWGNHDNADDVGELIAGVNYRVGEWTNSMDLFFRGEFITYDIDDRRPLKLSLSPVITFPDASSGFPVYFGAGLGLGIFFEQVKNESDITADYQVFTGLRDANLFDTFGLSFEVGLKGHINLLSSGQFSGVYFTVGSVHEF